MGLGLAIELQCLDCGNTASCSRFEVWDCDRCEACGREVHQRVRRNRRRTFCCDDCRRRGKAIKHQGAVLDQMAGDRPLSE